MSRSSDYFQNILLVLRTHVSHREREPRPPSALCELPEVHSNHHWKPPSPFHPSDRLRCLPSRPATLASSRGATYPASQPSAVLKYVPSQEAVSQRKAGRWFEFLGISSRLQDTASWKKKQTDYLPGFL